MRIACIHQGYELYGSDRSFVESVAALRAAMPSADIEVVLPRDGPIVSSLEPYASRIVFEPLWILRRKSLLRLATIELARLPFAVWRAVRRFRNRDLVYINTSIVTDYVIAARWFPAKSLLHIHEIPEGLTLRILRAMSHWSGAEIIFNSRATRAAFGAPKRAASHVIYNGVAGPGSADATTYDSRRPLRVLLLGRINRIKGQEVLLDALASLPADLQGQIDVRLVGGAFENAEREHALAELIKAMGLETRVSVHPFVADPAGHFHWADIVAMPSRRPESLGRVAIEAMAYGKPVLASAIGGLIEVVQDGKTGWLAPPGNAIAIADRLRSIVLNPGDWAKFGAASRARYEANFSDKAIALAIAAVATGKLRTDPVRQATDEIAVVAGADR